MPPLFIYLFILFFLLWIALLYFLFIVYTVKTLGKLKTVLDGYENVDKYRYIKSKVI